MCAALVLVSVGPPRTGVYRVARRSAEVFFPPPWEHARLDGTFGSRFDDPSAAEDGGGGNHDRYRVVYCATDRRAAIAATLEPLRHPLRVLVPAVDVETVSSAIAQSGVSESEVRAVIPVEWRQSRHIGHTFLDPSMQFVDLTAPDSIQHLRQTLAPIAHRLGFTDVDLGAMAGPERELTRACARYIYDLTDAQQRPLYGGLRYLSRLGSSWECWAIFHDRMRHRPGEPQPIDADDPDLVAVAALFGMTIEPRLGPS